MPLSYRRIQTNDIGQHIIYYIKKSHNYDQGDRWRADSARNRDAGSTDRVVAKSQGTSAGIDLCKTPLAEQMAVVYSV